MERNNRKILIVDDEAPIRDMLQRALNRVGYEVSTATCAEEALEILAKDQFPVIFIDLWLGTMDGFKLCELIRTDNHDAIIYALSGYAGLFDPSDFKEAGFDGYDSKPINIQNLFKIVKDSFERIGQLAKSSTANAIKRILIIDDDDQFRKMLRSMLENEGYTVLEASSGEEGYRLYSEQVVDLVITDIVMGGINGIETALEIKEEYPDARFIVISGGNRYGAEAEFEMANVLDALTLKKPFERKAFLQAIKQLQN